MPAPLDRLPHRLLSPETRLPKVSLWERAAASARQIREASSARPFDAAAFCQAANRGALAMAMAGDTAESERSCGRQARILFALIRDGSLPAAELPRILQPWINIGRLRVIQGRWEEALAHFPSPESLRDPRFFEGWPAGTGGLTPEEADLLLGSAEGRAFVVDTHVAETAKAYLRGGRADLLAAHVERWREAADHLPHLHEADALLALHGGRPLPAPGRGDSPALTDAAVEVHAAGADPGRAGRLTGVLDLLDSEPGDADLVTVLLAGAGVVAEHGRAQDACRFLRRAADVSRAIGDEADLFNALTALGRLDPDSGAAEEAGEVAADSGYAFVRARIGRAPLPPVADEPRLAVLRESEIEAQARVAAPLGTG